MKVKSLSRVQLFATPWTAAYQAPPSMGFSRQEYWSGMALTKLDSVLKKKERERHPFANKGLYSQTMVFPVVMYEYESWAIKMAER